LKAELWTCKQILVNNGYSNRAADIEISNYQARQSRIDNEPVVNENIMTIYYQNQKNCSYKTDEQVLNAIVQNNIRSTTQTGLKF
jgi:hypothetical protein